VLRDTEGSASGNDRVNEYFVLPDGHGEVSRGAPQAVGAAVGQRDEFSWWRDGAGRKRSYKHVTGTEEVEHQIEFAPPKAPHFQGLVEQIVGAAKAAIKPALRTRVITGEELKTIFAKAMGILNNFPISYTVKSDMDFHYRPLTPNHFLLGQPYGNCRELRRGRWRR
jgi:hypothetical protein